MNTRRLFNDINVLKSRLAALEATTNDGTSLTFLSSSLTSVGLYSGVVVYAGTGSHADVSESHVVYLDSTKQWRPASAGAGAAGDGNMVGISLSTEPHTDGVVVQGLYRLNSSYVSGSGEVFTVGSQVYMSPEASGSFTTTIPSGSGQVVRVVGHSVDSDMIYFAPSPDYIEI